MRYLRSFESVDSLSKVRYREIDVDIRDDIKDIFLDLGDDGYDVRYNWVPRFSEDWISSGNYPFVMLCKEGLSDYNNARIAQWTPQNTYDIDGVILDPPSSFRFSSRILDEYMNRLGDLLGEDWNILFEWMSDIGFYHLGKSGKVYNSTVYRILMVRL